MPFFMLRLDFKGGKSGENWKIVEMFGNHLEGHAQMNLLNVEFG